MIDLDAWNLAAGWACIAAAMVVLMLAAARRLSGQARLDREARLARRRYEALVSAGTSTSTPTQAEADALVCAEYDRAGW